MVHLKRFILMLQFFTSLPIKIQLKVEDEDFGKGLAFAPLVGLFIGLILSAVFYGLIQIFNENVSIVLVIITYIILTGGIHLDGLGDTFDGLFSNRPRERMLEIMRDSRVGTNAVLAVASLLLLNTTALISIEPDMVPAVLMLMPVAGRTGSVVGAGISKYARSGEGLGKSFIDHCGFNQIVLGILLHFTIFISLLGIPGAIHAAALLVFTIVQVKFFSRKIGGTTGDILGAVCELNQTFFLLCF